MRVPAVALLLALATLALPAGLAPAVTERPVWVHDADGAPLAPEAFPDAPRFEQRAVGEGGAFEPPLGFALDGTAFYIANHRDTPTTYPNVNTLWRSTDGDAAAWEDVTPYPVWTGVDPFLTTDPFTGRVFASTYHECIVLAWTDDAGDWWTRRGPVCDEGGVTDYPSLFVGPAPPERRSLWPSALYLCYHAIGHQKCQRSLDGGVTFLPMAAPWDIPGALAWYWGEFNLGAVDVPCEPFIGGFGHADPRTGTLYFGTTMCGSADLAVSRDFGLSWERAMPDGHAAAQWWGFSGGVSYATDDAGTTYALWIAEDDMPRYTFTADQGRTWAAPRSLRIPGMSVLQYATIEAGSAGRMAIAYVGSRDATGFNDTSPEQTWHAFVTTVLDADTDAPVLATSMVSAPDDPLRRGPCAGRCPPAPDACGLLTCSVAPALVGMGDYLFLRTHPTTGALWMSLVDVCNGPCAAPGADGSAPYGGDRASVGVQVDGLPLRDPSSAQAAAREAVVHAPGGALLPRDAFLGDLPVFAQRTVAGLGAVEPVLTHTRSGVALYHSGIWDNDATEPANTLLASVDDGATWTERPMVLRSGIDNVLHTDVRTGRVYRVLYDVACSQISWSDDDGVTWVERPHVCDALVTDHPTLWTGPAPEETRALWPSAVYLCYHAFSHVKCQRSLDGGAVFTPIPPPFEPVVALASSATGICEPGITGFGHADPATGTIFLGATMCGRPEVAMSHDHGLTWERRAVDPLSPTDPFEQPSLTFATDAAGTTYALWLEAPPPGGPFAAGGSLRLAHTRDDGRTWSAPIQVDAPGLRMARLPALAAGAPGEVAIAYVGTTDDPTVGAWHAFVSFVQGADTTSPVLATTTANDPADPIRRGPCEFRCAPEPEDCGAFSCDVGSPVVNMGDYTQLSLDPVSGRAWWSFVDVCTGPCSAPGATASTPYGVDLASVAVQVAGRTILPPSTT